MQDPIDQLNNLIKEGDFDSLNKLIYNIHKFTSPIEPFNKHLLVNIINSDKLAGEQKESLFKVLLKKGINSSIEDDKGNSLIYYLLLKATRSLNDKPNMYNCARILLIYDTKLAKGLSNRDKNKEIQLEIENFKLYLNKIRENNLLTSKINQQFNSKNRGI